MNATTTLAQAQKKGDNKKKKRKKKLNKRKDKRYLVSETRWNPRSVIYLFIIVEKPKSIRELNLKRYSRFILYVYSNHWTSPSVDKSIFMVFVHSLKLR